MAVVCLPSPEKLGIEGAVRVVPGHREGGIIGIGCADHDDLAVRLYRHRGRLVVAPEAGRLLSVPGEARIERALGLYGAREVGGDAPGVSYRDDLAVILRCHCRRAVAVATEAGRLRPSPEKLVSSEPSGL